MNVLAYLYESSLLTHISLIIYICFVTCHLPPLLLFQRSMELLLYPYPYP